MKVNIYVSRLGRVARRPRVALVRFPLRLPQNEAWALLRSGDTAEFELPEAVEEEIERRGIWAQQLDRPGVLREI